MNYTEIAVIAFLFSILFDLYIIKSRLLTRAVFWTSYAIIVFFIWVPVIGIVTAIIRKIAGIKKANILQGQFRTMFAKSG